MSLPGAPESARLHQVRNDEGNYVALSYCWDVAQIHCTTNAVYQEYLKQLPYSQLPQTILDAFRVTRNLRLQYIWIDSLRIIQDDAEDMTKEISKMYQIY